MNDILSIFIGAFIAPPLTSLLKNCKWQDWQKMSLAGVISLILSIGVSWLTDGLNGDDIRSSVGIILSTSLVTYRLLWQNTEANKQLEKWSPLQASRRDEK